MSDHGGLLVAEALRANPHVVEMKMLEPKVQALLAGRGAGDKLVAQLGHHDLTHDDLREHA